VLELVV